MLIVIAGALLIGVSLGLMGSGGSILTVPILHYLIGQPEKVAIAGSLRASASASASACASGWSVRRAINAAVR